MASSHVKFSNNYVKISDDGIDLTRSRFPYKHLDFSEIEDAKIKEGYLIKNRGAILIIGSLLLVASFGFLLASNLLPEFFEKNGIVGFLIIWRQGPIPVIVAMLILIYQSFIKSKVAVVKTSDENYSVRLKEIKDNNQAEELQHFLAQKISA